MLEARAGSGHRFVNAGQPAYGPLQYRLQLEHLLAAGYRPRRILVAPFTGNDIPDALFDKNLPTNDGLIGERQDWKHHVKASLHLYRLGARIYKKVVTQAPELRLDDGKQMQAATWDEADVRRAYDQLRRELATMRDLAAKHGAELRVALIPVAFAVDVRGGHVPARPGLDSELPIRKFLAACEDAKIPALDLTAALAVAPSLQGYLPFDGHLSPHGNKLVADALQAWWPELR